MAARAVLVVVELHRRGKGFDAIGRDGVGRGIESSEQVQEL